MKTFKKVAALLLAILMLASTAVLFSSCGKVTSDNPGSTIDIYLPYTVSLDPATAYQDEASAMLLSLVYEGLTTISSNGKVKPALAESWESYVDRDGNKILEIKLRSTRWSDGTTVSSTHFIDSWERILDPAFNCQAASLLYPIKNAAAVNIGDKTISDLGLGSANPSTLTITLEDWADPEAFLRNCASVALYPVRKDIIDKIYDEKNDKENDWSCLIAIMATNGPFYLKGVSFGNSDDGVSNRPYLVLERNVNYRLDPEKNESLDKYVLPYRINVNMTYGNDDLEAQVNKRYEDQMKNPARLDPYKDKVREALTEEEIAELGDTLEAVVEERAIALMKQSIKDTISGKFVDSLLDTIRENKEDYLEYFNEGSILLNGSLPLNVEETFDVESTPSMMTGTFMFNTQNEIFANPKVRQALSLALDREELAKTLKYVSPADTLITKGVFNTVRKTSFKEKADYGISTTANKAEAEKLVKEAGVKGKSFTITIRATETDMMVAKYAQKVWEEIGFNVEIKILGYSITTYTEDQLVNKTDDKGNPYTVWEPQIIYDGLLHDNYMDAYKSRDFDVIFYDVNMLTTDAFPALAQFASMYSGSSYDFTNTDNFDVIVPHISGYLNKDYDTLMQQAMVETDVNKRAELLHQAEALLLEDLPITPVIYYENYFTLSKELRKVGTTYFGGFDFSDAKNKNKVEDKEEEGDEEEAPAPEAPAPAAVGTTE